jgi:hypothetical protein
MSIFVRPRACWTWLRGEDGLERLRETAQDITGGRSSPTPVAAVAAIAPRVLGVPRAVGLVFGTRAQDGAGAKRSTCGRPNGALG